MSHSSHGGGNYATSDNPQGHRPSGTKHRTTLGDADNSDDVFMGPQAPQTPTKKRSGGILSGITERFTRSPSEADPPNRKRRADSSDSMRQRTDTVAQPSSRSARGDSDMDTTDSSSTTRAYTGATPAGKAQQLPSESDATNVATPREVSEFDLIQALMRCIQMAAAVATAGNGSTEYIPSKDVSAAYRSLGLVLEQDTDTTHTNMETEFEGVKDSMHAPKKDTPTPTTPPSEDRRITRLETAVADIASKFAELTHAILQGHIPDTTATPTPPSNGAGVGGQQPPATGPNASYATGPTYKPAAKAKVIPSFAARHHESRLIIKITPTPSREQQTEHSGPRIRDAINLRLRTKPETNGMFIGLVSWSNIGSAIINTADGLTAAELEPHADLFKDLLPHAPGATFDIQTDKRWYKVTLNGVPTRGSSHIYLSNNMETDQPEAPSPKDLLEELLQYNGWLKSRKIIGEPRWISAPESLLIRDKSSVVIAFANQEDADELVKRKGVFMFGHRATTRAYIDIPPLRHCTNCWKLDHTLMACKAKPRCRLCAGEHSTDEHACSSCDSIGSSCEHLTVKCTHCPNSDSPHFADSFACPYRRAYKGEAMAIPRTRGGRSKKKAKTKEALPNVANAQAMAPPPPHTPPTLTPEARESIRQLVKAGVPRATDQQIQSALDSTGYDLRDTLATLGSTITRTTPDPNQPDFPPR